MSEQSVVLDQVRRYWEYAGADVDRAHELYHDDAVLEFPQSGERFEGVTNFTEWRRQYPAEVRYRVRRITAREDLVVVEGLGQLQRRSLAVRGSTARVPRRQGGPRADLHHGGLGPRVASLLALGHSRRLTGVKH
jgi:SnoaL-like domain